MGNWLPALLAVYLLSFIICLVTIKKVTSDIKWIPGAVIMALIILLPGINSIISGIAIWKCLKRH